jgi:hypothetical protein
VFFGSSQGFRRRFAELDISLTRSRIAFLRAALDGKGNFP